MSNGNEDIPVDSLDIAIIGMECRFPGARNIPEFWRNLRDGVESIQMFSDDTLEGFGVDPSALSHPNFVKAGALIEDADKFDAEFFGYSPREAELMDPQQRVFLECAWSALESAGYTSGSCPGLIGVYAGTSMSSYLLYNVLGQPVDPEDSFQVMIENDKDFLSTRVSYELNLKGPSIDIQTACSTSLVATHLACQSLLSYQCDMALVGGVSIQVPQRTGHYWQAGGITSPDGHCRAFDAQAQGTIFGSGAGIVILKRLADALKDGDYIHALIKGSAINNDGSSKIGFTAPSVEGQSQVISMGQLLAGVDAETISYIETHGTGTPLGDPVEIEALTKAFRVGTDKKGYCAIGSVKTNIGHLDAAAGVAGLIKTVLALKHKQIPATLHYQEANPNINFAETPFYVNAALREWESGTGVRRAGVSSFGVGGTNAHVILEEAPEPPAGSESRRWQVLMVTAKSVAGLEEASANMAQYLKQEGAAELADVAYTLQVGRSGFDHRRVVVCQDREEAVRGLEEADGGRVYTGYREVANRPVVFMFPGGGTQYAGMASGIYQTEQVFCEQVDLCAEILRPQLGYDLRDFLYPNQDRVDEVASRLKQTSVALPVLFVVEYALAKLWMSWGINPEAMIGHSLGEYVAACLAGVFSLEDALALVMIRGRLLEQLPGGAMLSVPLPEVEVKRFIGERLSIAAINGPAQCVVSGPIGAIDELASLLKTREIEFRRIQIDTASHSPMVMPILNAFTDSISKLKLQPPSIPYLSNVTGTWITTEATSPAYWARHLRQTVRFADGVKELLSNSERVLLEVGPGHTLTTLARLQAKSDSQRLIQSIRHPYDHQPDEAVLLTALGRMWGAGVEVDWQRYYGSERRRRVPLPTYPFQRQRYWIEATAADASRRAGPGQGKIKDVSEWFYVASWKRGQQRARQQQKKAGEEQRGGWLIFADEEGIAEQIIRQQEANKERVVRVRRGKGYRRVGEREYEIEAGKVADYEQVLRAVVAEGGMVGRVVHLWGVGELRAGTEEGRFKEAQAAGYESVVNLAKAIKQEGGAAEVELVVVSGGMQEVESGDKGRAEKATVLGALKVISQEVEQVRCRSIDVEEQAGRERAREAAQQIVREVESGGREEEVAYRGKVRWVKSYEKVRLEEDQEPVRELRQGGVFLITGGMGGIGLLLARYLAEKVKARVILTGRSDFPEREQWERWIAERGEEDEISRKIKKVRELEECGGEAEIVKADVADEQQMGAVVDSIYDRYGRLDGVIHAAGLAGEKVLRLIPDIERHDSESLFRAKVYGLYVLERVLRGRNVAFCLLFSSNASILGGIGLLGYAAANLFMDAFAASRDQDDDKMWIAVNWDGWLSQDKESLGGSFKTTLDRYAMIPAESLEAFRRVATMATANQVIVSTGDLFSRIDLWIRDRGLQPAQDSRRNAAAVAHQRPALETKYMPPVDETQATIVKIWQELLGIERPGIHDNFFELGGNSLIGLKVISRLKKELGVDVPIVSLFEGPTVMSLAQIISRDRTETPAYEESRSRGERRRARRSLSH